MEKADHTPTTWVFQMHNRAEAELVHFMSVNPHLDHVLGTEGVNWIRDHHADDSEPALALLAAYRLR